MEEIVGLGNAPTFGAVGSGNETCIPLCQGAQGGRGRGANTTTFQQQGDEEATRESGCPFGWTMWTSYRSSVCPPGWRSPFRPLICRGTSESCSLRRCCCGQCSRSAIGRRATETRSFTGKRYELTSPKSLDEVVQAMMQQARANDAKRSSTIMVLSCPASSLQRLDS